MVDGAAKADKQPDLSQAEADGHTIHVKARLLRAWARLPRAMSEMHENKMTGIPIIRVAKDMPESVQGLLE